MKRKGWLIGGIALGALCVLLAIGIPLAFHFKQKNDSDELADDLADEESVITAVEHGARADVDLAGYGLTYTSGSTAFREKMTLLGTKLAALTGSAVTAKTDVEGKLIEIKTDAADTDIEGHGFVIRRGSDRISIVGTTPLVTQMGVDYFMNTYLTGAVISLPEKAVSDKYEMIALTSAKEDRYYIVYDADLDTRAQYEDNNISGNQDVYYGVSSETGRDYAYDVVLKIQGMFPDSQTREDKREAVGKEIIVGRTARPETARALSYLKGHEYGIMVINGNVVVTGHSMAALHKAAPLFFDYLTDARDAEGNILFPRNLRMIGEASDRWLTDVTLPEGLPLDCTADEGDGVFQYQFAGSDAVNEQAFDTYLATLLGEGYTMLTESSAEGSRFVTLTDASRAKMIHVSFNAYAHSEDNEAGKRWKYSDPSIRVRTAYTNSHSTHVDDVILWDYDVSREYKTYESGWRERYFYNPAFDLAAYRSYLEKKGFIVQMEDGVSSLLAMSNVTTGERIVLRATADKPYTNSKGVTYTNAISMRYRAPGLVVLPDSDLLNPVQSYVKVTESKVVSIDLSAIGKTYTDPKTGETKTLSGSYGTGYVTMLEDGRFVIIDGGAADGSTNGVNAFAQVNNFWGILTSLYKEAFGKEPTPENPAHIAAWIITHAHSDHMNMFWDFADRYGGGTGAYSIGAYAKLDYLIANSPDFTAMYNTGEPNMTLPREMANFQRYFKDGFTFIKAQTGQHYYLANMEIETLFTPGDMNPQRIVTYNDSSSLQRLYFRSTESAKGARVMDHEASNATVTTFLSTGDAYIWGGRWAAAMYGEYLKTDMVSVAHHGGPGVTSGFYDLVAPRAIWWSMGKGGVYNSYATGSSWHCRVDQHLMYDVASVEYIYIADDYHITLTLGEEGARYDHIRDAVTGEKISYYETAKSMTKAQKITMRQQRPVAVHKT